MMKKALKKISNRAANNQNIKTRNKKKLNMYNNTADDDKLLQQSCENGERSKQKGEVDSLVCESIVHDVLRIMLSTSGFLESSQAVNAHSSLLESPAVSKSRKVKGKGRRNKQGNQNQSLDKNDDNVTEEVVKMDTTLSTSNDSSKDTVCGQVSLSELSDDDLLKELARRKAKRFKLAGAMKRLEDQRSPDTSGQACTEPTA